MKRAAVVGLGSCGYAALEHLQRASHTLDVSLGPILGKSAWYANAATGGATTETFINGALVVAMPHDPHSLLLALRAAEATGGRVRAHKNGARAIDLDLLTFWPPQYTNRTGFLDVPHPRFLERSFALLPAIEALDAAGLSVPLMWRSRLPQLLATHPLRAVPHGVSA